MKHYNVVSAVMVVIGLLCFGSDAEAQRMFQITRCQVRRTGVLGLGAGREADIGIVNLTPVARAFAVRVIGLFPGNGRAALATQAIATAPNVEAVARVRFRNQPGLQSIVCEVDLGAPATVAIQQPPPPAIDPLLLTYGQASNGNPQPAAPPPVVVQVQPPSPRRTNTDNVPLRAGVYQGQWCDGNQVIYNITTAMGPHSWAGRMQNGSSLDRITVDQLDDGTVRIVRVLSGAYEGQTQMILTRRAAMRVFNGATYAQFWAASGIGPSCQGHNADLRMPYAGP